MATRNLKISTMLVLVCFILLGVVFLIHLDTSIAGQATSLGKIKDYSLITVMLSFLLIFAGGVMLVVINNTNPHLDQELASFKVDKTRNKRYLTAYLEYCKEKGRDFSDVKNILLKHGWKREIIYDVANKINVPSY